MITIITVTYNCGDIIQTTMESVKAVKSVVAGLKHIIIDGQSTDDTVEIIKRYQYDFLLSEKDKGIYDALNKGIEHVDEADYIVILHAGDTICLDPFKILIETIENCAPDLLAFSLSEEGSLIERTNFRLSLLSPAVKHPGIVISKRLHNDLGFYDLRYSISADYDFVCKILNNKNRIFYSNEVLINQAPYGFSGDQKRFFKKKIEHLLIISRHVKLPARIFGYIMIVRDLLKGILYLMKKNIRK